MPRSRKATKPLPIGRTDDFTQTVDQWEASVLARATYFTVVMFRGRGQYDRKEFPTLEAAREAARGVKDGQGRQPLIYAVSADGRSVQVPNGV